MASIPKVRDDDPEDVSWALSMAATQYARGDRAEALKWLRRAAEAASEAEHDNRALELAKAAADLASAPAPTPKAPTVSAAKKGRDAGRLPPKPPDASAPSVSLREPPAPRKKSKADETGKRGAIKVERPAPKRVVDEHTGPQLQKPVIPASEADGWPTEAMGQTELDALSEVYGQEQTRIGALPYKPEELLESQKFRASQAVAVVVWRAPDGTLRIAPKGTAVSAVTIEALLVAPAPDVDLLAWLG